jgi:RHS repeat-associated protein
VQAGGAANHPHPHDESRQPLADLDREGRITRQTVWLADIPLAVIDSPAGQALAADAPGLAQVWADVRSAIHSWLDSEEGIAWLHTNHLGAPEAATNTQGQLIWRARYAPFGAAQVQATEGFTLHLRLPGQVWDEETGLHYNRQRYYDPQLGQYLTPDPLGTPDGPNPYAYVAFNPLGFIDPDGLILFAFDGTGNTNDQAIAQ